MGGDQDDQRGGDPACGFGAADARLPHVEQDEIREQRGGQLDRLLARRCLPASVKPEAAATTARAARRNASWSSATSTRT
jgi:hypothetical protein